MWYNDVSYTDQQFSYMDQRFFIYGPSCPTCKPCVFHRWHIFPTGDPSYFHMWYIWLPWVLGEKCQHLESNTWSAEQNTTLASMWLPGSWKSYVILYTVRIWNNMSHIWNNWTIYETTGPYMKHNVPYMERHMDCIWGLYMTKYRVSYMNQRVFHIWTTSVSYMRFGAGIWWSVYEKSCGSYMKPVVSYMWNLTWIWMSPIGSHI